MLSMTVLVAPDVFAAEESILAGNDGIGTTGVYFLLVLGAASVVWLAYDSYRRYVDAQTPAEYPTRYIVRPGAFAFGLVLFVGIALALFGLGVTYPGFLEGIITSGGVEPPGDETKASVPSQVYILLVAVPAAINVLLTNDFLGNPFTLARRAYGLWARIPDEFYEIRDQIAAIPFSYIVKVTKEKKQTHNIKIKKELEEYLQYLCNDDNNNAIVHLLRNWVELEYLMGELRQRQDSGRFAKVFSDLSDVWAEARTEYHVLGDLIRPYQSPNALFDESIEVLQRRVDALERRLAELLTCFVIGTNRTGESIWADLHSLGVKDNIRFVPSAVRPLILIFFTVPVGILAGITAMRAWVWLWDWEAFRAVLPFSSCWPLVPSGIEGIEGVGRACDVSVEGFGGPVSLLGALDLNNHFVEWTIYTVVAFAVPILVVIVLRYFAQMVSGARRSTSRFMLIATAGVTGFLVAAFGMAAVAFSGEAVWGYHRDGFLVYVGRMMPWSIGAGVFTAAILGLLSFIPRNRETRNDTGFNVQAEERGLRIRVPRKRWFPLGTAGADRWFARGPGMTEVFGLFVLLSFANLLAVLNLDTNKLFRGSGGDLAVTLAKYTAYCEREAALFRDTPMEDRGGIQCRPAEHVRRASGPLSKTPGQEIATPPFVHLADVAPAVWRPAEPGFRQGSVSDGGDNGFSEEDCEEKSNLGKGKTLELAHKLVCVRGDLHLTFLEFQTAKKALNAIQTPFDRHAVTIRVFPEPLSRASNELPMVDLRLIDPMDSLGKGREALREANAGAVSTSQSGLQNSGGPQDNGSITEDSNQGSARNEVPAELHPLAFANAVFDVHERIVELQVFLVLFFISAFALVPIRYCNVGLRPEHAPYISLDQAADLDLHSLFHGTYRHSDAPPGRNA